MDLFSQLAHRNCDSFYILILVLSIGYGCSNPDHMVDEQSRRTEILRMADSISRLRFIEKYKFFNKHGDPMYKSISMVTQDCQLEVVHNACLLNELVQYLEEKTELTSDELEEVKIDKELLSFCIQSLLIFHGLHDDYIDKTFIIRSFIEQHQSKKE